MKDLKTDALGEPNADSDRQSESDSRLDREGRRWIQQQLHAEFLVRSPQVALLYIILGLSLITGIVAVPHTPPELLEISGWVLAIGSVFRMGLVFRINRYSSDKDFWIRVHLGAVLFLAAGLGVVNAVVIWAAAIYGDAPFWAVFMMAALSLGALTSATPLWRIFLAFQFLSLLLPGAGCLLLIHLQGQTSTHDSSLSIAAAVIGGFVYVVLQGRVLNWGHHRRFQIEWTLNQERDHLRQTLRQLKETHDLLADEQRKAIASSKFVALGEMASGIAHEINNPLAIIKGNLSILQKQSLVDSGVSNERMTRSVQAVLRSVERIASIIQALRLFARDGAKDEMTETRLDDLINQTVQLFADRLRQNSVKMELKYEADVVLKCRAAQLSQVLHSLLSNAIRAIEPAPIKEIVVEVSKPNPRTILVLIRDSGAGVAPEIRDRIFEPFFSRFEGEMSRGLGLSVARGIIEEHGGSIQVSEDHASQFEIRLPA